jgi:hypothetical protein
MVVRPPEQGGMVTGDGYGVFTGTIDGKLGTVRYQMKNIIPGGVFTSGKGTITILQGTGELAGIKGHGTLDFMGPGLRARTLTDLNGNLLLDKADSEAPRHFINIDSIYNDSCYLPITLADIRRETELYKGFKFTLKDIQNLKANNEINLV